MKKYKTTINIEVKAENEEEAISKIYEKLQTISINSLEVEDDAPN